MTERERRSEAPLQVTESQRVRLHEMIELHEHITRRARRDKWRRDMRSTLLKLIAPIVAVLTFLLTAATKIYELWYSRR